MEITGHSYQYRTDCSPKIVPVHSHNRRTATNLRIKTKSITEPSLGVLSREGISEEEKRASSVKKSATFSRPKTMHDRRHIRKAALAEKWRANKSQLPLPRTIKRGLINHR